MYTRLKNGDFSEAVPAPLTVSVLLACYGAERATLDRKAYVAGRVRSMNESVVKEADRLPAAREGRKALDAIDLNAYPSAAFSMFSGEECCVKLRCVNRLADVIFDRFGMDTMLIPDGAEHFMITVPIEVSEPFCGWVCGFGKQMKILHPPQIVRGMRDFYLILRNAKPISHILRFRNYESFWAALCAFPEG